jgi:hypothetical protein
MALNFASLMEIELMVLDPHPPSYHIALTK